MTTNRIVFVVPGWPPSECPSGIVTYVNNLRGGLASHGVQSRVLASMEGVSSDGDVAFVRPVRSIGAKLLDHVLYRLVPERSHPYRVARPVVAAVRRINRDFPLDMFEMEESHGIAECIRRKLRIPLIVRLHGPWFLNGPAAGSSNDTVFSIRVANEGTAIRNAQAVTSPSKDILAQVQEFYGIDLRLAAVIPNPGPNVSESNRWEYSRCDPGSVLFVGRFDRLKGGDIMIEAFREVAASHPNATLLFAGPDSGLLDDLGRTANFESFLSSHVVNNDIRGRIQFLGHQTPEQIACLRQRASVTVVASRRENFPMTVLEAMAYGSPLVTSDAGGIPEMVQDGETALMFRTGDAMHLASKLAQFLGNAELSQTIAERARCNYETRYSPTVVGKQMADFYAATHKQLLRSSTTKT